MHVVMSGVWDRVSPVAPRARIFSFSATSMLETMWNQERPVFPGGPGHSSGVAESSFCGQTSYRRLLPKGATWTNGERKRIRGGKKATSREMMVRDYTMLPYLISLLGQPPAAPLLGATKSLDLKPHPQGEGSCALISRSSFFNVK